MNYKGKVKLDVKRSDAVELLGLVLGGVAVAAVIMLAVIVIGLAS